MHQQNVNRLFNTWVCLIPVLWCLVNTCTHVCARGNMTVKSMQHQFYAIGNTCIVTSQVYYFGLSRNTNTLFSILTLYNVI